MLLNLNGKQKIDYRLDTIVNQRLVDSGKIEVGRKVQRIIGYYYFIHPPSFSVFSLQICGLKAD